LTVATKKKNNSWPDPRKIHTIVFDFDGVFTDNTVYLDQNGIETARCHRGDGMGIKILLNWIKAHSPSLVTFVLSTEINPVVSARTNKLRIGCHQNVSDKTTWLDEHLKGRKKDYKGLIYLGNDLNDLAVMKKAGFSVAPSDAHPRVLKETSCTLDIPGGHGFVREFVERLLRVDKMKDSEIDALVSRRSD
jgi:YrbI family 3-deoxy-D-manno-octulosonate 8-phosphate phosphatase